MKLSKFFVLSTLMLLSVSFISAQTTVRLKDQWGSKLYYVDNNNTIRIKDQWGDKVYYFDGKTVRIKTL